MIKQMVEQAQLVGAALVAIPALRPMVKQAQLGETAVMAILARRPELSREQILQGAQRLSQTSITHNTVQVLLVGQSLAMTGKPLPWE
ncbi:hypothetical protein [Cupriavidus necator]|uniref:hypothetical protein n=1 Tax=Cupriavidus necator TaxID=106590 RepID=UPI000B2D8219|nr:hypothetical protein [Cupriavidus necator]